MPVEVDLPEFGTTVNFPDGTTDEEIAQELNLARANQRFQGNPALAVASALQPAFSQLATPASTLPDIGGGSSGIGLTPELQLQNLAAIQQDQQNTELNRVREQAQNRAVMAQQQEAEKDRAQQVKIETQRFKNEQAIQKLRQDQAIAVEKQRAISEKESDEREPEPQGRTQVLSGIGPDGKPAFLRVNVDTGVTEVIEGFTPAPKGVGAAGSAQDPVKNTKSVVDLVNAFTQGGRVLTPENLASMLTLAGIDPDSAVGVEIEKAYDLAAEDAEKAEEAGLIADTASAIGKFFEIRIQAWLERRVGHALAISIDPEGIAAKKQKKHEARLVEASVTGSGLGF